MAGRRVSQNRLGVVDEVGAVMWAIFKLLLLLFVQFRFNNPPNFWIDSGLHRFGQALVRMDSLVGFYLAVIILVLPSLVVNSGIFVQWWWSLMKALLGCVVSPLRRLFTWFLICWFLTVFSTLLSLLLQLLKLLLSELFNMILVLLITNVSSVRFLLLAFELAQWYQSVWNPLQRWHIILRFVYCNWWKLWRWALPKGLEWD